MAPPRGSAAYKKKDGTLALSKDLQTLSWTPVAPPGSSPAVTISVPTITNLQQTPKESAKVMLKVFAQPPAASASEQYVFSFTSPTAPRAEADAIKDALSESIQAAKSASGTPAANGGGGGQSAAMAIASALSSGAGSDRNSRNWYDDAKLQADVELQQSLLKADPQLQRTFMESLRTKPESITNSQFTKQFWTTRTHLLRAHAAEKHQTRGAYNVLSSIKPKTVENTLRLNISKEQIQQIFSQHPLVKRVYDENVPKLSEEAFWSRFFQSRLFKKLKGEKIGENDSADPILDKYLRNDEDLDASRRQLSEHIPHIIDIEGNEENHSQRKGNQPDLTMRWSTNDKVPILRRLNNQSEVLMRNVAKADVNPADPIGIDEKTFNELALQDLQGDTAANRIVLNIKDQDRFFSDTLQTQVSADALLYAKQDPNEVLTELQMDLDPNLMESDAHHGLYLDRAIGIDEDSSSDEDDDQQDSGQPAGHSGKKTDHVGSKSSLSRATSHILSAISEQRSQSIDEASDPTNPSTTSSSSSSSSSLSPALLDRLTLTHATTTEFLHYFWHVFLSGSSSRAAEIGQTIESLHRATQRMEAVAADAQSEHDAETEKVRVQIRERERRTGKRVRVDVEALVRAGGRQEVEALMAPTRDAVRKAVEVYEAAVREETRAGASSVANGDV
ncbi:MAG: hypothetical protein M1819_005534 [Sarea resinae]|nr:MAG: hypothetical protein M1819_005534 [Sarea resinae]